MDDQNQPPPAAARPRLGKRLARWAIVLLVPYVLLLAMMMLFEESLIFFPAVYPEGDWTPLNLTVEDASFQADGLELHGWYVEVADPRAVVLIAHGNAGNVSHRAELLRHFRALGASALVFDYRGFGRSTGSPSETGVLADARAARKWLSERAKISADQIVLCGESLGGGVVVDLAAADGARGLILLSTFDSLPSVAAYHFPWVPTKLLLRTRLDSVAKIAKYHGPLLQIHGTDDTIVPFPLAQRLFAAAGEPKELIVVENGDHNDPLVPVVLQAIDRFLSELPKSAIAPKGE